MATGKASTAIDAYETPAQHLQRILNFGNDLVSHIKTLIDEGSRLDNVQTLYIVQRKTPKDLDNLVAVARRVYQSRRKREMIFNGYQIFGEPAWDILLDIFISSNSDKRESVSSVCIASGVPPTTALRWLNELERHGMIEREPDEKDRRRSFISLSQKGCDLMMTYFEDYGE